MPGLIILAGSLAEYKDIVLDSVYTLLYRMMSIRYDTDIPVEKEKLVIISIKYPGYPVYISETDDEILFLEGKIYDRSIDQILNILHGKDEEILKAFLEVDGDYIAGKISPNRIFIINDPAGQLPFRYLIRKDGYAISRIPFILDALFGDQIDVNWISEMFILEHQLANHSIMTNIKKNRPGIMLYIDQGKTLEKEY